MMTVIVKLDRAARDVLDPIAFTIRDMRGMEYGATNMDGTRHIVEAVRGEGLLKELAWGPALDQVLGDMATLLRATLVPDCGPLKVFGSRYDPDTGVIEIYMEPAAYAAPLISLGLHQPS